MFLELYDVDGREASTSLYTMLLVSFAQLPCSSSISNMSTHLSRVRRRGQCSQLCTTDLQSKARDEVVSVGNYVGQISKHENGSTRLRNVACGQSKGPADGPIIHSLIRQNK